jgi:hypothetical protein
MSNAETSLFLDRAIMKETRVFLVTRYNPVFILVPLLSKAFDQQKGPVF